MLCELRNKFNKLIRKFDGKNIDFVKDKQLRFNVWKVNSDHIEKMFESGDATDIVKAGTIDMNGEEVQSNHIRQKIENGLKRINESDGNTHQIVKDFTETVIGSDYNIEKSIALHEVMESVKGEADKARNNTIETSNLTDGETQLPGIPLARVAASIGRKIAFQKGYRFHSDKVDQNSSIEVEYQYYRLGKNAIESLVDDGYLNFHSELATIKDYLKSTELKKDNVESIGKATAEGKHVLSVTINETAFGITKGSREADYFLKRSESDLIDTPLEVITDMLRVVQYATQPSTLVLPDTSANRTVAQLAELDRNVTTLDAKQTSARHKLYKAPLYVNTSVHELMKRINERVMRTGESATQVLRGSMSPEFIESLFGIQRSDDHSIDKKQSITGQNLSKTTPFNDLGEVYGMLMNADGSPSPLHMALKVGRNERLYYENSVLNAHASKSSRAMLTPGPYSVKVGSNQFKKLVYSLREALGDTDLSYKDFTSETGSDLDLALKQLAKYQAASNNPDSSAGLDKQLIAIQHMANLFPGVQFANLITALQGVSDIRNPAGKKVTTEFPISSDATASGGQLTMMQALGTNENVVSFLERIGIFKGEDGKVKISLRDLYGLMEEAMQDFVNDTLDDDLKPVSFVGKNKKKAAPDNTRELLNDTLNMLFNKGEDAREMSKDPTMVFIYGQGEAGSEQTIAAALADRIFNSLESDGTREYLAKLLGNNAYLTEEQRREQGITVKEDVISLEDMLEESGLYEKITNALITQKLPATLWNLMDSSINGKYLEQFKSRGKRVWAFVKKAGRIRMLPASAVMSGVTENGEELTKGDLQTYGMPISKIFEVSHTIKGTADNVLTQQEKPLKTVLDVSTIHGIDAAQLYPAADDSMDGTGVIVVHDQWMGTINFIETAEKSFRGHTKDIMKKYDIHHQAMLAVALYNPEIAKQPAFKALLAEIVSTMAVKQKLLDDRFDPDTPALIGDGDKFLQFENGTLEKNSIAGPAPALETSEDLAIEEEPLNPVLKPKKTATKTTKTATKPKRKAATPVDKQSVDSNIEFSSAEAMEILKELGETSETIKHFVDNKAVNSQVAKGAKNEFQAKNDILVISDTDTRGGKSVKQDINTKAGRQKIIEMVEHEILHSYTVGYIQQAAATGNTTNEMKYVIKAMEHIDVMSELSNNVRSDYGKRPAQFSDSTRERLEYALGGNDQVRNLAEFVAIMETEPEVAREVVAFLGKNQGSSLRQAIAKIIKMVKRSIATITSKELDEVNIDPDRLMGALTNIVANGVSMRLEKQALFLENQRAFGKTLDVGPGVGQAQAVAMEASMRYVNQAVASMITTVIDEQGQRAVGKLHKFMYEKVPMYMDVTDKMKGLYDNSNALQEIVDSITGGKVDKVKKAKLLADNAKLNGQQQEVLNHQLSEFHRLLAPLTDKEKTILGKFVTRLPLHDYFTLMPKIKTVAEINSTIEKLEKSLPPLAVKRINELIDWNVKEKQEQFDPRPEIYNLATAYPLEKDNKLGEDVRKLLALKSIKEISSTEFVKFLGNTPLVTLVKDNSIANRLSLGEVYGVGLLSDSAVKETYKERFHTRAITKRDFPRYENGEETGWKILRTPTDTDLGIVYEMIIDSTDQMGMGTDLKLSTPEDIEVFGEMAKYDGVAKAPDETFKLMMTKKEKQTLGLVEDVGQVLARSTAYHMGLQDTIIIRDELVKAETRMVLTGDNTEKLEDIIKSDNIDNPWFIKLEEGVDFSKLPAAVRAKYKSVDERASNVRGFNEEVTHVRKDISHWLMGGTAKSLFADPKYRWMLRIVKDLVSASKIGMVVLNPMKIVRDNFSNLAYLGMRGVTPAFAARQYKSITEDFGEYNELQRELVKLRVQLVARPKSTKIKQRVKSLQDRLDKNPLGDISDKGFVNSLGSDLVSRHADTLSGLQADTHTALEYLLTDSEGRKNYPAQLIVKLQNIGWSGENFLQHLGEIVGRAKMGEGAEQELDQVAERLKTIRSEEDVINYVSQFTTSPGAETVRIGSSLTDLTDVLAKETLYRHLIENEGMSPTNAKINVLDSFPDYKENMPMVVKQLSDVGILMFPSFWLRVQKSIYRLARDQPVNLGFEILLQQSLDTNIGTILGANVINKANTFGGFIHMPAESVGLGSFFPTYLWRFVTGS